MNKARLRQELKVRRQELSVEEVQELSQKIAIRALEILNALSISSMHVYLPIEKQQEVDTWPLIKAVWQKYPTIKTATWHKPEKHFEPVWFNAKGHQEPVPDNLQFDLIIVPLLGFNNELYRIGHGGGFYDKFLVNQKKALKIGLSYEFGHVEFKHESHDIFLNLVVTEKKVYYPSIKDIR